MTDAEQATARKAEAEAQLQDEIDRAAARMAMAELKRRYEVEEYED